MNIYCVELNLDIYPLKDNFNPLTLPQISHQSLDVKNYINPQLVDFLKSLNIYISFMEAFVHWNRSYGTIHLDNGNNDISKLNWVFGGTDSYNEWFQIKSNKQGKAAATIANTSSTRFNESDIEKKLFTFISNKKPFIFQAGIPHRAVVRDEKRCCISMIPRWIDNNRRLTFQETADTLSNYLV